MIKTRKFEFSLIFALFMAIFIFIKFNNNPLIVQAYSQDTVIENVAKINDGISNWVPQKYSTTSNNVGEISLGKGVSLDYAFGAARDSNNNIILKGADNTILNDSSVVGATSLLNSKINVFLNNNGKYYGILHQGEGSYKGNAPQYASDTSLDFALVKGISALSYSNYSILNQLKYKVYYTSTDSNGKPVFKIAGFLSNQGLYAEILLRPSPSGSPIVQRELYLYNPGPNANSFQVYYGEDTDLDSTGSPSVDDVPMYALGNNEGLYIYSSKTPDLNSSKLFVTNDVKDGFDNYMGEAYNNPYDWSKKGRGSGANSGTLLSPTLTYNKTGTGYDGDYSRKAGSPLLFATDNADRVYPIVDDQGKQNSAYALRWKPTALAAGATAHYASTIGASLSGYSVPTVSKKYTNSNMTSTGANHVGDTLHFTLTVQNDGYNSKWNYNHIVDTMPKGLTLEPSTAKYQYVTYTSSGSGNGDYDKENIVTSGSIPTSATQNNAIDFNPQTSVIDKGKYIITFDAVVNNNAPYNTTNGSLTNKATYTGYNEDPIGVNTDYKAEADIPIVTPTFNYQFTKQIRNVTDNGSFDSSANGKKGDTVEYKTVFTSSGSASLQSAHFSDVLPSGLKLDPDSITLNGSKKDSLDFDLGSYSNSTPITVDFKAQITGVDEQTVTNIANLTNVKVSSGTAPTTVVSDPALLNIQATLATTSFVEVPTAIDFGSVNTLNHNRYLPNVRTDGRLIIDHTADTPFQVGVSYDNDKNPIANNGDKLNEDTDDGILFFNQGSKSNATNWQTITKNTLPIDSNGFSGSQNNLDLSSYIGPDKWKLLMPANAKAGKYSGQITWSIYDTPQD